MSEDRSKPERDSSSAPDGTETAAAESGAIEETEAPETAEAEAAVDESPEDRTVRLEAEVADLRDQLLRALAEAENQRRRSQREREEAVRYAAAPMLRDLLAVADNLQRALDSVPADQAEEDGAVKILLEGVQLTERELQTAFERHGIVKLDPLGERLNPHHHEAMFEVPAPDQPNGTIVQVVQSGYLLHDRLLRPARVGVAKGGPAAKPAPADDDAADDGDAADGPAKGQPGGRVDTSA